MLLFWRFPVLASWPCLLSLLCLAYSGAFSPLHKSLTRTRRLERSLLFSTPWCPWGPDSVGDVTCSAVDIAKKSVQQRWCPTNSAMESIIHSEGKSAIFICTTYVRVAWLTRHLHTQQHPRGHSLQHYVHSEYMFQVKVGKVSHPNILHRVVLRAGEGITTKEGVERRTLLEREAGGSQHLGIIHQFSLQHSRPGQPLPLTQFSCAYWIEGLLCTTVAHSQVSLCLATYSGVLRIENFS